MLMLSLNKRLKAMHSVNNDRPTLIASTGLRSPDEQLQHSGTQHVASTSRVDISSKAETSSRNLHSASTTTRQKRCRQMSGVAAAEELKEKRAHLLPADTVAANGSHSGESNSIATVCQVSVSSDGGMSASSPSLASAANTPCTEDTTKKRPRTPAAQTANAKEKHPMLCPCSDSCRRQCTQKISDSRRSDIYTQYWQNPYDTRRTWMYSHIVRVQVQRRRPAGGSKSRQQSYLYKMPTCDGSDVFVCKTFFLHTLGYKSDKVVTCLMQSCDPDLLSPEPSKRGGTSQQTVLTRA